MVERSRFWNGTSVGDAVQAPYDAPDEFAQVLRCMIDAEAFPSKTVVFSDVMGELLVQGTSAPTAIVSSGCALVHGSWYETDTFINLPGTFPSGSTRMDLIVLRKDWGAQTVRVVRIVGTEGGGIPAVTQSPGFRWDAPIAMLTLTTSGTMAIQDRRNLTMPIIPPAVQVARTTLQNFANGSRDVVVWNAEVYKNDPILHDGANLQRLVAPKTGLYQVGVYLPLQRQPGFNLQIEASIRLNGTGLAGIPSQANTIYTQLLGINDGVAGTGVFVFTPWIFHANIEVSMLAGYYVDVTLLQTPQPVYPLFVNLSNPQVPLFWLRFLQNSPLNVRPGW